MFRRFAPLMTVILLVMLPTALPAQNSSGQNANSAGRRAQLAAGQRAQRQAGQQAPMRVLARFLQLDQQQVASIKQLFDSRKTTLQPLMEQQKQYRQVIANPDSDPASVQAAKESLQALRLQLQQEQTNFVASFEALLTPEQVTRFQALQRAAALQQVVSAVQRLRLFADR